MAALIDSSLWVDYFRAKTPKPVLEQVAQHINDQDAVLCEPVRFEVLRGALTSERRRVEEVFETIPILETPASIWRDACDLGQTCLDRGIRPANIDLLIASVCLHHDVQLVTFDTHFRDMAKVCPLNVRLLKREV